MKESLPKKSSITLHAFHLPVLVTILLVIALGAGALTLNKRSSQSNRATRSVLSEENERDNEDADENDNDSEENKNEVEDENDLKDNEKTSEKEEGEIDDEEDKSKESTEEESENEEEDNEFELTFKPGAGGIVNPALSGIIKAKLEQEIENEDDLGTQVNKVELEIKTTRGTFKYEGTALKAEKLFGVFGVEIPIDIEVDPVSGKILAVNQSFWAKILDFFSF